MGVRGITCSVNFGDLLAITLPRNARLMDEILVVTDANDAETQQVVSQVPNARLFVTDAFYRQGARFNRGLALEEGFAELGREGWLLMLDADTLLPSNVDLEAIAKDTERLYSPWRRVLDDPSRWRRDLDWAMLPRVPDKVMAGYFQLFHAEASSLSLPWYGTGWDHAADCDSYFCRQWSRKLWTRLDFDVLHLGPIETNWLGRISKRADGQIPVPREGLVEELQQMKDRRKKFRVGDPRRWEGELL